MMTILRKSVTLNPGQSKVVDFSFIPREAKAYQVAVDNLIGSFNAIGVAKFAYVSDVRYFMVGVDPYGAIIQHGEIDVKNTGDTAGVCSVELYWQVCIPMAAPPEHPELCWSGFSKGLGREPGYYELGYRYFLSATLQPGEVVTFFDEFDYSSFANLVEIYFTGTPGKSPTKRFGAITD